MHTTHVSSRLQTLVKTRTLKLLFPCRKPQRTEKQVAKDIYGNANNSSLQDARQHSFPYFLLENGIVTLAEWKVLIIAAIIKASPRGVETTREKQSLTEKCSRYNQTTRLLRQNAFV